jgi:alpha-beta hydrolase superfamily lysophospholipase
MIRFISFFILFAIALFLISFSLFVVKTFPVKYQGQASPREFGLKSTSVTFNTSDGILIVGQWIFQNAQFPTVILCHSMETTKENLYPLARVLARENYNVLVFDFRAHGQSGGQVTSFGLLEKQDLKAALDFLSKQSLNPKIGIYGLSMGASVALLVAAEDVRLKAVAADSPYDDLESTWMRVITEQYHLPSFPFRSFLEASFFLRFKQPMDTLSVKDRIGAISPRPIVLIFGQDDLLVPIEAQDALFQAAQEPKSRWVVEQATHGQAQQKDPEGFENALVDFFKQAFKTA